MSTAAFPQLILRGVLAIACAVAACGAATAAAVDFRFAVDQMQGEFDSLDKVKLTHIPLEMSFGGLSSRFTIRIPYVRLSRTGNVVLTADGPAVIGVGGPGSPQYQTSPAGASESGLGDVILRDETYFLRTGRGKTPALSLLLDYKWATADEKKGLGTGEYEWGAGINYVQPLSVRWRMLVVGIRRFMKGSTGMDFRDRWLTTLGLEAVTTKSLIRIKFENQTALLGEVPIYDSTGTWTGLFKESEDRLIGRFDWISNKGGGGTFLLGVWGGLTDFSEQYGISLSWSTIAQ
jgi:hypothetical protein